MPAIRLVGFLTVSRVGMVCHFLPASQSTGDLSEYYKGFVPETFTSRWRRSKLEPRNYFEIILYRKKLKDN